MIVASFASTEICNRLLAAVAHKEKTIVKKQIVKWIDLILFKIIARTKIDNERQTNQIKSAHTRTKKNELCVSCFSYHFEIVQQKSIELNKISGSLLSFSLNCYSITIIMFD